jgi:hypothetical protein
MRTSPSGPTDVEIQAFTKFAIEHEIITDGETGIKNADILCNPIIVDLDADITPQALLDSFQKVRSQLKLKSATYKRADELASKLSPEEIDAYKVWAKRQTMLIGLDGSPEGYQNVASLLGWMRGNPVTGHNLNLALGNIINNPQVGQRIHFKPQPKQSREVVQGKPNHAFGQEEPKPKTAAVGVQQQEYVNGYKNHGYVPPEEAAKKVAVQAPDAWKEICQLHLREWITAGQRAKLEGEYNQGIASGKSHREIATSLAAIIRDQQRGR